MSDFLGSPPARPRPEPDRARTLEMLATLFLVTLVVTAPGARPSATVSVPSGPGGLLLCTLQAPQIPGYQMFGPERPPVSSKADANERAWASDLRANPTGELRPDDGKINNSWRRTGRTHEERPATASPCVGSRMEARLGSERRLSGECRFILRSLRRVG
jgi:hypothetical protein